MADTNPPTPGDEQNPKRETVRITLPPKPSDAPDARKETIRIDVPGKGSTTRIEPGAAPKKESTRMVAPVPEQVTKPAAPAPPSRPGAPLPPRPLGGAPSAPKPPSPPAGLAPKPPGPLKPASVATAPPVTMKPASPKKETARIQVGQATAPKMPQATVKLQPTQPLAQAPAPMIKAAAVETSTSESESDPMTTILSWVVLVASLAAAASSYLAFSKF